MRILLPTVFTSLLLFAGCDCASETPPSAERAGEDGAVALPTPGASSEGAEIEGSDDEAAAAVDSPEGSPDEASSASAEEEHVRQLAERAAQRARIQPSHRVQGAGESLRLQRVDGSQELRMPQLSLQQYEERHQEQQRQRDQQHFTGPGPDFDASSLRLRPEIAEQLEEARRAAEE